MTWGLSISNEEKVKLVVCTPQAQKPPVLESFLNQLKGQTTLLLTSVEKFADIYPSVAEDAGALILISILTKDDLPEVLQMLAKLGQKLTSGTHRLVVYNQLNNDKLVAVLRSKGVSEILESNVSLKAFQYKFNKVTQLVFQSVKRSGTAQKTKQDEQTKTASGGSKGKRQVGQVVFQEPIEHFSDFWLLMNPKNVRYMIGKWFTNFYGPGPNSGVWESFPETKNGELGWVWNPRKADDKTFYQDEGRWVFFGNCPEFSWEEKTWYFISKTPEFSFYLDKKIVHTKIKVVENGDVHFCQNSVIGKNKQGDIADSIEASIRLQTNIKTKKDEGYVEEKKKDREFVYTEEVQKKKEKDYSGRFADDFIERKKKLNLNYNAVSLTLGLVSKNGEKIKEKTVIELIELREKYVVLDTPAGMLNVDDMIELEAFLKHTEGEQRMAINAATQIVETESEEDLLEGETRGLRSVVICELNDTIAPQFIALVKTFQTKREGMSVFFSKAKGVA